MDISFVIVCICTYPPNLRHPSSCSLNAIPNAIRSSPRHQNTNKPDLTRRILPRPALVCPHPPLLSLDPLDPGPPTIPPNFSTRLPLPLLLVVDLDDPIGLASLVGSLVTPLGDPLAGGSVELHLLPRSGCLGFYALLPCESLPFCFRLRHWHGLFTGQAWLVIWQFNLCCGWEGDGVKGAVVVANVPFPGEAWC